MMCVLNYFAVARKSYWEDQIYTRFNCSCSLWRKSSKVVSWMVLASASMSTYCSISHYEYCELTKTVEFCLASAISSSVMKIASSGRQRI